MTRPTTTTPATASPDANALTASLQQLADRAVRARYVHGLLLGVESDDGATSVRVAAGDARRDAPT